jgi:hypothetical protein
LSEEKRIHNFGRKSQGNISLGRPREDVRIILKCILEKKDENRLDTSGSG